MAKRVPTTLGDNVARLRRKRGIDQGELAGASQVTRSTIIDIERGRGNPRLDTLQAIAEALGVLPSALLTAPSSRAEPFKSPSPSGPRLIEESSPDKILGLTLALSNIVFVDSALLRRFEEKNRNSLLTRCNSYEEMAERINRIFGASVMDAAYCISGDPTRYFQRYCDEVGKRSEQLLTALGYPLLPLDEPGAIQRDYSSRIAPQIWQMLKLLQTKQTNSSKDKAKDVLISSILAFSPGEKIAPFQLSTQIVEYLHLLRAAGRLLPQIREKQKNNLRRQSTFGDALFFNIAAAYFLIYRVAPKMTGRQRGPYGHATGWAMRILKLGACRLRYALDSGELGEHRANPWLGHLERALTTAAQVRRGTIALRMEQGWREVQAVNRGEPRLLPTRRVGFLGTNFEDS